MTTVTDTGLPTLKTLTSRMDPDGAISKIGEMLDIEMPELEDIPWVESNLPTGHLLTNRTALPSAAGVWRKYGDGVVPTKSRTAQFEEGFGRMEDFNEVDEALAEINGNSAAFRASEAKATIQMFSQELSRALWYESITSNPEKIHGLSARYAASTGYTSSSYVLPKGTLGGVNGESVWLITWEPDIIYGIYPKGTMAGLQHKDLGLIQTAGKTTNSKMMVWSDQFVWRCGIAVQDYRYACRLQWDPDDSGAFADTHKSLYTGMDQMMGTVKKLTANSRFYMSRTSFNKFRAQLINNSAANMLEFLTSPGGRRIPAYCGTPIRICDSLVGETVIS